MPIVIMGCKNIEKDTELFNKIAEALAGKNILVLSARDENYKTVGASAGLASNQKVGAESAVDINLCLLYTSEKFREFHKTIPTRGIIFPISYSLQNACLRV